MISIKGLDKAEVLAALYNASGPLGMGIFQFSPKPMTREEAQEIINANPRLYFDYVKGRVMKIDLSKDEFEERLYDRDNGPGAAAKALSGLLTAK